MNSKFEAVFILLKAILLPYQEELLKVRDLSDDFYLNTHHIMKNKQPLFFAAVQIKKRYVTYHLMPVYVFPELLDSISDRLATRMQGKSCFNFTKPDETLIAELRQLTHLGYRHYQNAGYIRMIPSRKSTQP